MIVSISRRTDIPALYSSWLARRLSAGFVLVPNPFNPRQVSRISLDPSEVDCLVFWSKNPGPMLDKLDYLEEYSYYFQITLNAYSKEIEPGLPSLEQRLDTFRLFSSRLGPERAIWRYDPVFLSPSYTIDWHSRQFAGIASQLSGYTRSCIISFGDIYPKIRRKMEAAGLKPPDSGQIADLAAAFSRSASRFQISLATCAETVDLSSLNIGHASCIDRNLIEKITGKPLTGAVKDKNQRPACGCIASVDIGMYNTCRHGCVYCYANSSRIRAERNYASHDPDSLLLAGNIDSTAVIRPQPPAGKGG